MEKGDISANAPLRTLRIGIDGRPFQGHLTGIGRYATELCKELDFCLPEATFIVYSQFPVQLPVENERWVNHVDPMALARRLKPILWLKLMSGRLCKQDNIDIYWASGTILPNLGRNIPCVSTIHDVTHLLFPKSMASGTRIAFSLFFKSDIKRANLRTANSNGTALRIAQIYGLPCAKVIRPSFSKNDLDVQTTPSNKSRSKLGDFFLCVATIEPRKNIDRLLDGFLHFQGAQPDRDFRLVLVGSPGWRSDQTMNRIRRLRNEGVSYLGYVERDELTWLYQSCVACIVPSLYEGFGMPVTEARSLGARVVASDIPEIREAGDESVIYVAPTVEGIAGGLASAWRQRNDPVPAYARSNNSWKSGAESLAECFLELHRASLPNNPHI